MASLADNAGKAFNGERIAPGGPAARMTALPVMRLVEKVKEQELPCALSLSAGAYVCNDLYWSMLTWQEEEGGCPCLFVHVPSVEYLPSRMTADALQLIISGALAELPMKG